MEHLLLEEGRMRFYALAVLVVATTWGCGGSSNFQPSGTGGASGSGTGGSDPGGAGGTTGSGGISGSTGGSDLGGAGGISTGSGGGVCPSVSVTGAGGNPECLAPLCGNGMLDTCGGAGAHSGTYREQCDGNQFSGMDCQGLRLVSGTLRCTANCELDATGCEVCEALSAPVVSCGTAPGGAGAPTGIAVAATDAEIGLAWVEGGGGTTARTLRFARLSPTLSLLSNFKLDDVCDNFVGFSTARSAEVEVAPLPSGWVVVADSNGARNVDVYAIDAQGRLTAKTTVPSNTAGPGNYLYPRLTGRPGGAPLLTWSTLSDIRGTIVASNGASVATPFVLPLGGVPASSRGATFIGESFYVATSVTPPNADPGQLRIARIEPDTGTVSVVSALPGQIVSAVSVVAGAPDLQLLYGNADSSAFYWQRFDTNGVVTSPPLATVRPGSAVALAGGAFIFTSENQYSEKLGFQTVTAQGQIGTAFQQFARGGASLSGGVVRRGPDAIAAWIGGNKSITIARVTP